MDIFNSFLVNKYIAHRGYHTENAPENSLAAFQNAIDAGFAIELDVQRLSDGTIAVFHDECLSRMTGKDGYLRMLKKADLKKYKLQGTDQHIPTFAEVLKLVDGKVPLLIEIKNEGKIGEFEKDILEMLKKYSGEFAIQSFNPFVLMWFKQNAPEILRGQLASFFKGEKMPFIRRFVLKRMKFNNQTKPDFISYNAKDLPNRFVKKYNNLPLLAWTIRSKDDFMKAVKHCDNMIFEGFDINKAL